MVIWLFKPFPPQLSTWFVYDPFPYINSLLTLNMIQLVHHNTRKLTSGQASASYRMRRKFLFRSINIGQTIGARGPFINYVDKEKGGRLAKCQEYYIILYVVNWSFEIWRGSESMDCRVNLDFLSFGKSFTFR